MKSEQQQSLEQMGNESLIDLLEAFPTLEAELMELYSAYVLKEISSKDFEQQVKKLCAEHVRNCVVTIKQGIKADKSKRLINAYFDVARYQTDRIDAALEWNVDEDILGYMLKRRPPPTNPEDRLKLSVPIEVTKKRGI